MTLEEFNTNYSHLQMERHYYVEFAGRNTILFLSYDFQRNRVWSGTHGGSGPRLEVITKIGEMIPSEEELSIYNKNKTLFKALTE